MRIVSRVYAQGADYAAGTERITYASACDGAADWFCYTPGDLAQRAVVFLHGAFSEGDQLYTRADLRAFWLTRVLAERHPLITLNMRGTSYMNPAAAADAHALLAWARRELGWGEVTLLGGSGGAFSALIYGLLYPADIQGIIAMGACDLGAWYNWLAQQSEPLLVRLAESVRAAYCGSPAEEPALYEAHSLLAHADHLRMPVTLTMGEADALIPIAEARRAAAALAGNPAFRYVEVPGGDHDSAVWVDIDLATCLPR
ncbi:MAG: alpha/beta fold hydrolase [Chloroflexi bacterium]|nr:alpha/beta fold hydrolase [Chloroflexota bacterium]